MDTIKKLFPGAFKAKDIKSLIIAILIYIVVGAVAGFVIGLLSAIPLLGLIFRILGTLVELYVLLGVIFSVLVFVGVLK